jgi:CRP-like cAMP-binding protein
MWTMSQEQRIERSCPEAALLWHLADRFGRVRPDGVALQIPLKHATMAKLLAATRPSVSTTLASLASQGRIERLPDGGWLLKGEPLAARRRLSG